MLIFKMQNLWDMLVASCKLTLHILTVPQTWCVTINLTKVSTSETRTCELLEMTQWGKAFSTTSGDLSSIPRNLMVEGENQLPQDVL